MRKHDTQFHFEENGCIILEPSQLYDFEGIMQSYHLPLHKYMSRILRIFLTFIQIIFCFGRKNGHGKAF